MKQWLKKYWLWVAVGLFFIVWNGFLAQSSLVNIVADRHRIAKLEVKRQQYRQQIVADSVFIAKLKTPEFLERVAREKYYMMREGEQIYEIIEK